MKNACQVINTDWITGLLEKLPRHHGVAVNTAVRKYLERLKLTTAVIFKRIKTVIPGGREKISVSVILK